MKISKPVLVALILAILFAGYMTIFTGKRRPIPKQPSPGNTIDAQTLKPQLSTGTADPVQNLGDMKVVWRDDPFTLPRSMTDRKPERPKGVLKLVAIMENQKGRVAIISGEIVRKGDMIGDEKVEEIGKDRVTLTRDKAKRTLSLEDMGQ